MSKQTDWHNDRIAQIKQRLFHSISSPVIPARVQDWKLRSQKMRSIKEKLYEKKILHEPQLTHYRNLTHFKQKSHSKPENTSNTALQNNQNFTRSSSNFLKSSQQYRLSQNPTPTLTTAPSTQSGFFRRSINTSPIRMESPVLTTAYRPKLQDYLRLHDIIKMHETLSDIQSEQFSELSTIYIDELRQLGRAIINKTKTQQKMEQISQYQQYLQLFNGKCEKLLVSGQQFLLVLDVIPNPADYQIKFIVSNLVDQSWCAQWGIRDFERHLQQLGFSQSNWSVYFQLLSDSLESGRITINIDHNLSLEISYQVKATLIRGQIELQNINFDQNQLAQLVFKAVDNLKRPNMKRERQIDGNIETNMPDKSQNQRTSINDQQNTNNQQNRPGKKAAPLRRKKTKTIGSKIA